MPNTDVILRFNKVSFAYGRKKILDEVVFSVRRGMKLTLMGQNGAGKSTIFQMITGEIQPEEGAIIIEKGLSIAVGKQVIPRGEMGFTVLEFFERAFPGKKCTTSSRASKRYWRWCISRRRSRRN